MEEARYWMWAKRKPDLLDPHHHILAPTSAAAAAMNSSYGESWEEQAFAEDAAGALGGCVWPPRSYSCSFCRREFRSAQALGGHMNVHRRDRARLKQSPMVIPASSPTEVIHSYPRTSATSFDAAAPPPYSNNNSSNNSSRDQMMCSFSYNNNPNPDFSTSLAAAFRVSSSAEVVVDGGEDKIVTSTNPCFFSSFVGKNDSENMVPSLIITNPPSWSSFIAEKRDRVSDSIEKKPAAGVDQQEESRAEKLEDCVTDDLSTSLNLVVRQTNASSDEEVVSFKRRRVETTKRISISLPELSAADRSCLPQSEVFKLIPGSVVELDLELRLGNGLPKVK